uniref:fibronectin isoform X2 n=1 Tax=Ciona intestinalis TaxID=7719 RepID=UPI0002B8E690|nr:fibronectin isoform X2 [Ciona intestinalis]|eukprot:XP_002121477.2 fibronectin isoform X2 [Ciona intestinalis]
MTMGEFFTLVVIAAIFKVGNAALIVPVPAVMVQDVTTNSITLNWTMPHNEFYDKFIVRTFPSAGIQRPFLPAQTFRVVENLQPGYLYTFTVTASRGAMTSDIAVLNQDTIPLPPQNLALETFDQIELIIESPYFENTQFTLNFPGIEAVWEPPTEGFCDCYDATISPSDGQMAFPTHGNENNAGTLVRQFIRLTPGKTYTITLYSTTCGTGELGVLRSDPITRTIVLQPSDPPPVTDETGTTSTTLKWQNGVIVGLYDNFEIIGLEGNATIAEPESPMDRQREITGLNSCTEYSFEVFTLYENVRSRNGQRSTVYTKPEAAINLRVIDFNSTSLWLSWMRGSPLEVGGYKVTIQPPGRTVAVTKTSLIVTGLSPGTMYNVSVISRCVDNLSVESVPVSIQHATVPYVPQGGNVRCEVNGPLEGNAAIRTSVISMSWSPPIAGDWDGFVIDYSPYQFEIGTSYPPSPIVVGRNVFRANITLPVAGRILTIYLRTKRGNVLSVPNVLDANCADEAGVAIRRCRISTAIEPLRWNITITLIRNDTYMFIQIPHHPIRFSLIHHEFNVPPYNTADYDIIIRNPCISYYDAKLVVYPVCPEGSESQCSTVVRRLCTKLTSKPPLTGNDPNPDPRPFRPTQACCNGIAYNPFEADCCHNQLLRESTNSMGCCFTRWYNVSTHACCGTGRVRSLTNGCQ